MSYMNIVPKPIYMTVFSSDMHKVSKIPMEAKSVLKFWSLTMVIHAVKSSKVMFRS